MNIATRLSRLYDGLTPEEAENYKLLLCMAAGGLAPRGATPQSIKKTAAFRTVLDCLRDLQPPGTMWCGRPELLSDELLKSLQRESESLFDFAKPTDRYLLACGGPVANGFASYKELTDLVIGYFPGVSPTGVASYIYYDEPGHGLDPHVDTEIYSVNVILMLNHTYKSNPSSLLIYKDNIIPDRILLKPGEMAIINAGSVIHAREDMGNSEHLSLLTVGFQYLVE